MLAIPKGQAKHGPVQRCLKAEFQTLSRDQQVSILKGCSEEEVLEMIEDSKRWDARMSPKEVLVLGVVLQGVIVGRVENDYDREVSSVIEDCRVISRQRFLVRTGV
jgi:hypothetical protein